MRSGPLRDRIVIARPFNQQDSQGAPIKTWITIAVVQAQVNFISGRELFSAQQADLGEATVRIIIRETPNVDIDADCRITDVDSGAVYDVVAVLPDRLRHMITIAAKSGSKHP